MPDTINHIETILRKLEQQIANGQKPTIVFFDIDGTVFTAGLKIVKAPFYNSRTMKLFRQNSIPFVLITGRAGWNMFAEREMYLHGISPADAIVTSTGTEIYERKNNRFLEKDLEWSHRIHPVTFNKTYGKIPFRKKTQFLYTKLLRKIDVNILYKLKHQYEEINPKIKFLYSESRILHNSYNIFSGNVLLVPKAAGKENAVKYILSAIHQKLLPQKQHKLHVYLFGDASIDIPMLALQSTKSYKVFSFLVDPTPLARQEAKNYSSIHIAEEEAPKTIAKIMHKQFAIKTSHAKNNNVQVSPAQNSKKRKIIKVFEPLLNTTFDKYLSANDISFLGLRRVIIGIHAIKKGAIINGLWNYTIGNLTDVFDGIRARSLQDKKSEPIPGQLVDVFCDRTREFYQLFKRGEKYLVAFAQDDKMVITFLSAISCILPSIARAQAEMQGIIVPERDQKGGSTFDRTRLLFLSLFYFAIGNFKKSYQTDAAIYEKNMATYENRMSECHSEASPKNLDEILHFLPVGRQGVQDDSKLKHFQKDAHERFLLLAQLLQEANQLIENELKFKATLVEYKKWQKKYIHTYLSIDVHALRKKYHYKTYDLLTLYKYIQ